MTRKRKVLSKTTALIVDGAYARIQGRKLGGNIDFAKLRTELEEINSTEFEECWYFDSQRSDARGNSAFHTLKYARPHGPQFHVQVFSTKPYNCHCKKCGHNFTQNVQKGVDNGIATKLLTLTMSDQIERIILFSGDGDFYISLRHVRCELRREIWVVGFWGTVSGDLQQLASRIIWMNDLWGRVKLQGRRECRGHCTSSRKHEVPRRHRKRPNRNRRDTLNIYGRASHRSVSPRREHSPAKRRHYQDFPETSYRSLSGLDELDISDRMLPSHDDDEAASVDEHPLYDDVNLSGSEDEETKWSSLLASPSNEANVNRSSESMSSAKGEQRFSFPLPMAAPSATSTERTDRSRRHLGWAFGENT